MQAQKDLGEGLRLRWSTPADADRIAKLNGDVFRHKENDPPNIRMMDQASIMMRDDFPYMTPYDLAVVEDTRQADRPIVACSALWQHRWSYGGISFSVGRPELVATDPAYRHRGLIRHIFRLLHERSDGRGDLMQGITGIPYFYRQFGYEMALDLDTRRVAFVTLVPEKKPDEQEHCGLRPAQPDDVAILAALHNQNRGDSLLWHEADEAFWRYLVTYWLDPSIVREDRTVVGINAQAHLILDPADDVLGMVVTGHHRWGKALGVYELALAEQTNLQSIMPSLLRALHAHAEHSPTMHADGPALSEIAFYLGRQHPLYALMGTAIAPRIDPPYAWYIRIPDVPAFICRIAPVLEDRLARSVLTGHTGDLYIDFYRGGLHLAFEQGRLTVGEDWQVPVFENPATAGFPPLVFIQLLLGYRSRQELGAIFPDVWINTESHLLIDTLFPKQPSVLMPMG